MAKPVYKSIYDFRGFFNTLKIKIVDYFYEDFEPIIEENNGNPSGILPPGWPFPGVHIYLNGLEASYLGNYLSNTEFRQYFELSKQNILTELEKNIKCSTSNKEMISYLTEVHFILKNCDSKIVENRINSNTGIQCNYSYKGSEIEKQGFENYPEVDKISKEYLNDLLYWIKNQIRDLIIQIDKISTSIKPIVKGAKMIKSFKFTKPTYFPSRIPSFFTELRDHEFISNETKVKQLEEVFSDINISTINKPIMWMGDIGDLKVLIHSLIDKKIIEDPIKSIWKITIACFVKRDGFLFDCNSIKGSKATLRANEVKSIVNRFLD
jgi:hypothetical protein